MPRYVLVSTSCAEVMVFQRALLLSAAVVGLSGLAPAAAWACSPHPCHPAASVPGDGASVPANLSAIALLRSGCAPFDEPRGLTVEGGAAVPVVEEASATHPGVLLVRPQEGALRPGSRVILGGAGDQRGPRALHLNLTAPAPPPVALGALSVDPHERGPVVVATDSGACSEALDAASAKVSLTLHPSAEPWRDAFLFETWVDGQLWRPSASLPEPAPFGGSWVGRGQDLIYAACTPDHHAPVSLSPGPHRVELVASLPGAPDQSWRAGPVEVVLRCGDDALVIATEEPVAAPAEATELPFAWIPSADFLLNAGKWMIAWWTIKGIGTVVLWRRRHHIRDWLHQKFLAAWVRIKGGVPASPSSSPAEEAPRGEP
ncbi:MAG: hypothetical protein IPO67_07680 [Deltaproteobacteria bacterium]|nr:hypothetical protein [Deltaproteobacteria bacterium]